ncbi:hypothetical protein B0H13DRAFT_1864774 [Mycena leptocephala]|nr:hypothetical protein B0H13DRAFT_1864774 [Mycena leptocephala]
MQITLLVLLPSSFVSSFFFFSGVGEHALHGISKCTAGGTLKERQGVKGTILKAAYTSRGARLLRAPAGIRQSGAILCCTVTDGGDCTIASRSLFLITLTTRAPRFSAHTECRRSRRNHRVHAVQCSPLVIALTTLADAHPPRNLGQYQERQGTLGTLLTDVLVQRRVGGKRSSSKTALCVPRHAAYSESTVHSMYVETRSTVGYGGNLGSFGRQEHLIESVIRWTHRMVKWHAISASFWNFYLTTKTAHPYSPPSIPSKNQN